MKEIPLSQGRFCKNKGKYVALVDDCDFKRLNQYRWSVHKIGKCIYAVRIVLRKGKQVTKYMHGVILRGKGVDHIDHNGLNNQRANLRLCTQKENCRNRSKKENCISIYRGVSFSKQTNKWVAQIRTNGKGIGLGSYEIEVDAAKAYNVKAIELFGEFANLNIL